MSDIKPFVIRDANRVGIIPLLGLWGSTGSGKTKSALMLMRGIVGPKGRLGVADTEGKRASYYFDDPAIGGFKVIDFEPPFTPERYVEVIDMLENNFDGAVIDSASHCWEGPDGVLDLHEQALDRMTNGSTDWKERERLNWPAWREPKMRFAKLRNRILACKIPLIVCFRGKFKTRMKKIDGKNTVETDTHTTPIFDDSFIFEMHVAIEVFQKDGLGGYVDFPMPYAKTSHPDLRRALPAAEKEQLKSDHGAAIARWCFNPSTTQKSGNVTEKSGTITPELKALKKQLWDATQAKHNGNPQALEQWLIDEGILSDTEMLEHLAVSRYPEVIEKSKQKINNPQA